MVSILGRGEDGGVVVREMVLRDIQECRILHNLLLLWYLMKMTTTKKKVMMIKMI